MISLSSFVCEALKQSTIRDNAIVKLVTEFGFQEAKNGSYTYLKKDGKTYDLKVHMMPFTDKCLIVNYDDFHTDFGKYDGFVFINAKTDFQNVAYMMPIPEFKQYIDSNINNPKSRKFIWPSKQNELRLFDNPNFFGVTIAVDALEKEPWFTTLTA